MKIVYVVETFTDGLGYIDNILPVELGNLGNEVHVLTCRLPVYYYSKMSFFGELTNNEQVLDEENYKGIIIHTCSYINIGKRVLIRKLHEKLSSINPDVVVVRGISSPVLGQVILSKLFVKFKLFTSTGRTYLSLPKQLREGGIISKSKLLNIFIRIIPGKLFSLFTNKCIGSTSDCVDVVVDFYGVPRSKTKVISLGVNTEIFHPVQSKNDENERINIRKKLGIPDESTLCIWTGRMTGRKGLFLLAKAVEELNENGYSFKVLYIGSGPEADELSGFSNVILYPFTNWVDLPKYYRAADIAVWPRGMTTSTLDASACGLPVILSNKEQARERWEGIGDTYNEGDVNSLKLALIKYLDESIRYEVKNTASSEMKKNYSWNIIAKKFQSAFIEF